VPVKRLFVQTLSNIFVERYNDSSDANHPNIMIQWPAHRLLIIRNGFRDTAISLHSSETVDKKEILRTVSNTGIYCSSYIVGTVYLV
jgi:hypothetical protein